MPFRFLTRPLPFVSASPPLPLIFSPPSCSRLVPRFNCCLSVVASPLTLCHCVMLKCYLITAVSPQLLPFHRATSSPAASFITPIVHHRCFSAASTAAVIKQATFSVSSAASSAAFLLSCCPHHMTQPMFHWRLRCWCQLRSR
jgi:hypothetical protein